MTGRCVSHPLLKLAEAKEDCEQHPEPADARAVTSEADAKESSSKEELDESKKSK